MFMQDYVLNGQGFGDIGSVMEDVRFEPGLLRPYYDSKGRKCCTIKTGKQRKDKDGNLVYNSEGHPVMATENVLIKDLVDAGVHSPVFNTTSLRKQEWIQMDNVVLQAARQRLRAWSDLAAANPYTLDGMTAMILEHEMDDDGGEAIVDMDGISESRGTANLFKLQGIPLPITHGGFQVSQRRLAISRKMGQGLDTRQAEKISRRVAEMVEKTLIGVETGVTYGRDAADYATATSKVYGYTNHPNRITKTDLTTPSGSNSADVLTDVLEMIELANAKNFYGPFMLYHTRGYSQWMNSDYYITSGTPSQTLRERILKIPEIRDVRRLDFWPGTDYTYQMLLVQMTSDVAQAVNGMDIKTVQWEGKGGMVLYFKVMCIYVPRLRCDYNGYMGLVHARTAA